MLELSNISFCAEAEKEILKDINMTVQDGEFLVITGPNGGGKSTLAKVIAGIEAPSSGTILLDGNDITNEPITARAKAGISFAISAAGAVQGNHSTGYGANGGAAAAERPADFILFMVCWIMRKRISGQGSECGTVGRRNEARGDCRRDGETDEAGNI